jgi:hypothetical protein
VEGVLEIDKGRGVIYFHSNKTGHSLLRICQIPRDKIPDEGWIDLTIGHTKPRKLPF